MPKPGHNAPAQHEKTIMLGTAGKENTTATPVIANQCAHWCGNPFPFSRYAGRLFWVRQDKRIRIPVRVQMNYNAARFQNLFRQDQMRLRVPGTRAAGSKTTSFPSSLPVLSIKPFSRQSRQNHAFNLTLPSRFGQLCQKLDLFEIHTDPLAERASAPPAA